MACQNCYLDLCEILVCDEKATIEIPQNALQAGTYKIILDFQGTAKVYETTFQANEKLIFELDCINENYCYEGYILGPDNQVVTIFTDTANTAFKFCTKQISLC